MHLINVVLATHTTEPMFALFDIGRFDTVFHFKARVQVRSSGFMLDRPFYFDLDGLANFVEPFGSMDRITSGMAELRTPYQEDFIHVTLGSRGRVNVSGEVRDYSEFDQRLRFAFETDQTLLRPFACDLKAIFRSATS